MVKYSVQDDDGNADKCCIHLPLKKAYKGSMDTFICVYLTAD